VKNGSVRIGRAYVGSAERRLLEAETVEEESIEEEEAFGGIGDCRSVDDERIEASWRLHEEASRRGEPICGPTP
jgi:hypothetical protein